MELTAPVICPDRTNCYALEGQWNHWAFVKNSSSNSAKIYLNGSLWASAGSTTDMLGSYSYFTLGAIYPDNSDHTHHYSGSIDEFRVSKIERSADWIKAEYENQKSGSTFLSVVTE